MDKISGIISTSPRITAVDPSLDRPVRSGAPPFGRPVSEVSVDRGHQASAVTQVGRAHGALYGPNGRLNKDQTEADIIKKLSDDFFRKSVEERKTETEIDYEPVSVKA